jgi:type I restriction enzyme M protein
LKGESVRISCSDEHIEKIVDTYQFRREEQRYSVRVSMDRIEKEDCNLNISRYVSTSVSEKEVDLATVHLDLVSIDKNIRKAKEKHNAFLEELGLPLLP